jgi:hypothetical protein
LEIYRPFSVVGTGDFNGDGIGDILWQDTSGNLAVWLMNGATVLSSAGLGNVPTVWSVVGIGDFNGDGNSDILWRDSGGDTSIWFMNGTQVASSAGVANIPTNWSVVGTGDFNGDSKSDIVLRDNVGDTAIWLMNGATVSSAGALGNERSALARHQRQHRDVVHEWDGRRVKRGRGQHTGELDRPIGQR